MPNTLEENVNRVKAAKTAIANAITAKGGTVSSGDGLEDFASDIATIPSGGVEFSNNPDAFRLKTNIKNMNVDIPEGCTTVGSVADTSSKSAFGGFSGIVSVSIPSSVTIIGKHAFAGCSDLKSVSISNGLIAIDENAFAGCSDLNSIVIPKSITSINSYSFTSCNNLEKIYIDKLENSISGSPWGAPNAIVIWRKNRYTFAVNEASSGTTLTTSVSCTVGDLVIATFVIRGNTYTISNDWTLIGLSEAVGNSNQRTGLAYKIAASTTESLTVTQDSSARIYTNLVAITGASIGTFSGFTTQATGSSITMNRPNGLVVWVVSSNLWGTVTPYLPWGISDTDDITAIQLPTSTQPRCLTALDQGDDSTVTFRYSPDVTGDAALAAASLTITGIDNFWYYDEPQT